MFVAGSAANMAAQAIVFPFDTIRKRLMNDGIDGRPKLYRYSRTLLRASLLHREPAVYLLYIGAR